MPGEYEPFPDVLDVARARRQVYAREAQRFARERFFEQFVGREQRRQLEAQRKVVASESGLLRYNPEWCRKSAAVVEKLIHGKDLNINEMDDVMRLLEELAGFLDSVRKGTEFRAYKTAICRTLQRVESLIFYDRELLEKLRDLITRAGSARRKLLERFVDARRADAASARRHFAADDTGAAGRAPCA